MNYQLQVHKNNITTKTEHMKMFMLSRPQDNMKYMDSTSQELCTGSCLVVFCCGLVPTDLTHILKGYFTGTGAIWLPQCQWSNPEGYG